MFEHSQGSGNSTVVITDEGVLVFDFHIDNADQTLAGIRKLTDKKVKGISFLHIARAIIHPAPGIFDEDKTRLHRDEESGAGLVHARGENSTSGRIPIIRATRLTKKGNWCGPISVLTEP